MSRFMHREERIRTPQGEFLVRSINPDSQTIELLDPSSGELSSMTAAAMRRQISDGSVRRLTVRTMSGTVRDLAQNEKARQQHMFNMARVRLLEKHIRRGESRAEAIRQLRAKPIELDDGTIVPSISERQAYRLLDAAANCPLELMPAYADRGNRQARHSEEVDSLVHYLIDEAFAKVHSRITMLKLAELATALAREKGLITNQERISRDYVQRTIINDYSADISRKRLDPRIARSAKHVAQQRIVVDAALQRVEQDTVTLPFLVKTTDGILQNPYLMVSIDCGSGVPLGWHLSATPVTEEDTLDCLEVSLYSKAERLKLLEIDCEIDPYGLLANWYLDNGPENKGQRVTRVAELGIFLTRVAAHSGHRKPFIERFFKSLKSALESLPGCTRFEGKDGVRTELAKEDQLMTIEQLERWIVRWFYEYWIHKTLDRFVTADYELDKATGITPFARWKHFEQNTILPPPPDPDRWIKVKYLADVRSLSAKTGLSIEGFRFKGDNLRQLIGQYGPDSKVTAYYNPSDYRFAYVADIETGELVQLVNAEVSSATPAFSFSEAKKQRTQVRQSGAAAPPCANAFERDLANASLSGKRKKTGHTQAQREVREASKLGKAIDKSRKNPVPTTPESSRSMTQLDDLFITDDAIPQFVVETKPRKQNGGLAP